MKTFAVACSLAMALFLFAQHKPAMPEQNEFHSVIDLTHALNDHLPNWEGTAKSPFQAHTLGTIRARRLLLLAHLYRSGALWHSHLDAPAPLRGAWTVDQIPAERLVRPLVVLDVRKQAQSNPDYEIGVAEIAAWEDVHGMIPNARRGLRLYGLGGSLELDERVSQ